MNRLNSLNTLVGAGVLFAALSACGGAQDTQDGYAAAPPPATATQEPGDQPDRQPARTPPEGGAEVPEAQIDPAGLAEGYPVMVWTVDDGTTLGVVAQEGGCGKASAEVTEQSDSQVAVKLVETTPADKQMCTMDLRYPKLTLELDQPLGAREVALTSEKRQA
ncbi:hypothetical protein [Actinokineospora pegani]|uniref:hypothetical protein n=1 Tax=Actinokineospora pegani TaxID=2654637 RepID=UPI0012EA22AE|nr:hypothetical protein [Actinokineospora pegani]